MESDSFLGIENSSTSYNCSFETLGCSCGWEVVYQVSDVTDESVFLYKHCSREHFTTHTDRGDSCQEVGESAQEMW